MHYFCRPGRCLGSGASSHKYQRTRYQGARFPFVANFGRIHLRGCSWWQNYVHIRNCFCSPGSVAGNTLFGVTCIVLSWTVILMVDIVTFDMIAWVSCVWLWCRWSWQVTVYMSTSIRRTMMRWRRCWVPRHPHCRHHRGCWLRGAGPSTSLSARSSCAWSVCSLSATQDSLLADTR